MASHKMVSVWGYSARDARSLASAACPGWTITGIKKKGHCKYVVFMVKGGKRR